MSVSRALACLVIGLTFASACTGAGSVDSAPATEQIPEGLAFIAESADEPILRIAVAGSLFGDGSSQVADLDPLVISQRDRSAVVVSDLLYDGLTEVVGQSGELRPGLALSWEANDDFTQWNFVLDTERTNSGEVKESFERLMASGGLLAALLDDVVGAEAFRSGDTSTVQGLASVDEETFRIHLAKPNAGLVWLLSGIGFSVVGRDGRLTGRYELDGSVFGEVVAGDDPAPSGNVELVSVMLLSDEGSVELVWASKDGSGGDGGLDASALRAAGRVDVAVPDSVEANPVVVGAASSLEDALLGGGSVLGSSRFFVLNGASEEMADLLKREAIVANVDSEALAQAGDLLGVGDGGVLSSVLGDFESAGCVWCDVSADRQRDLAQVVPTVGPLLIGYIGPDNAVMADLLVEQLGRAGFSVSALELSPAELTAGIAEGSVDLFLFGWTAPAGSLDGSVEPLFASSGFSNVFGVGWAEVDGLLEEAGVAGDDQERWRLLREAELMALSQFVAVPLGSQVSRVVGVEAVDGLVVRADGSFDLVGVG